MIAPWLNMQVRVQRRPTNPTRNSLNEPTYGDESGYPIIYDFMWTRVEYIDRQIVFSPTGERDTLNSSTVMYVEPEYVLRPMDRIIVQTSDNPSLIGQLYLVEAVYSEWDSIGNVSHYIVEIQVH